MIFHKIRKLFKILSYLEESRLSLACIVIVLKFTKNKIFVENFLKLVDRYWVEDLQKYEEIILLLINFDLDRDLLFDKITELYKSGVLDNIPENSKNWFYNYIEKICLDIYKNKNILEYDFNYIAVSIFIFLSNFWDIKINIDKYIKGFNVNEINIIIKTFFTQLNIIN